MHTKMELVDKSLPKTSKIQRNDTNCAVDINDVSNSTHQTSSSSFANAITMTSIDGDTVIFPPNVNYIISISINSIACPFTVLLNVLVIIVVKKKTTTPN